MIRREKRVQNFASPISYEQYNLISLDGLPLDSGLANLKYTAIENYDIIKNSTALIHYLNVTLKLQYL